MSEAQVVGDKSFAEFSASVPENHDYYAVYPYAATASLTAGRVSVEVPETQTGTFADANITVAKADSENTLAFRHVVGYVEFITEKTGTVEFCGAENDVLTGKVVITGFDERGNPLCSYSKGTSKVSVKVDKPGTYHMAVVPGAVLNGFTIIPHHTHTMRIS